MLLFRKHLQRSGKDHAILMVLPSGVYQYKFIVDGQLRYTPDLPFATDGMGSITNILDVHVSYFSLLMCVSASACVTWKMTHVFIRFSLADSW